MPEEAAPLDPVEALLSTSAPEVQAISRALRDVIARVLPQAHEFVYRAALNYALSEAARMSTRICCIAPLKRSVNLVFFAGVSLPDPQHLLVGSGSQLRHVHLKTLEDARSQALEPLLARAWGVGWMGSYR